MSQTSLLEEINHEDSWPSTPDKSLNSNSIKDLEKDSGSESVKGIESNCELDTESDSEFGDNHLNTEEYDYLDEDEDEYSSQLDAEAYSNAFLDRLGVSNLNC